MKIAVVSCYRDSASVPVRRHRAQQSSVSSIGGLQVGSYIWNALQRVRNLQTQFQGEAIVEHIAGEGDSVDATRELLASGGRAFGLHVRIVDCTTGAPRYGSVETAERMSALSSVANRMLDAISDDTDYVVYVESDLDWSADVIAQIIRRLSNQHVYDVISPLVFAGQYFYDVWGFRGLDGERFSPFAPFHRSIHQAWTESGRTELVEVSSLGSCLVMRRSAAEARILNGGALVEWSSNARQLLGLRLACWPALRIHHPV